eukprot:SAG22_NODE_92_length_20892_cov_11.188429_12_plen_143_part_00
MLLRPLLFAYSCRTITKTVLLVAQDQVVALFGAFLTPNATASPVTAMPIRQLLAFQKVTVQPNRVAELEDGGGGGGPASASAAAAVVVLRVNVSDIPAVDRQPWPGVLSLWVGDGGGGGGGAPAPQRRLATAAESASVKLAF